MRLACGANSWRVNQPSALAATQTTNVGHAERSVRSRRKYWTPSSPITTTAPKNPEAILKSPSNAAAAPIHHRPDHGAEKGSNAIAISASPTKKNCCE